MILLTSSWLLNIQLQVRPYPVMSESTTQIQMQIQKRILSIWEQKSCCLDIEEKPFNFTWRRSYYFLRLYEHLLIQHGDTLEKHQPEQTVVWLRFIPRISRIRSETTPRLLVSSLLWRNRWYISNKSGVIDSAVGSLAHRRPISHMAKEIARCYLWVYVKTKFLLIEFS
jgi:hypothetical protein